MIRPLMESDIPELARLQMRVAQDGDGHSLDTVRATFEKYFARVFLNYPGRDERSPSLVHEERDGRISGLICVVARPMSFNGKSVNMAVSTRLIVDPEARSQLAGVQLLKTFMNGPQDLSITDFSTPTVERIWDALGGRTATLYSLRWLRILNPCQYGLARIEHRKTLSRLAKIGTPAWRLCDRLATTNAKSPLRIEDPQLPSEPLTQRMFLANVSRFTDGFALQPVYDADWVSWLWSRFGNMWDSGAVHKVAVKNNQGDLLGWYIYNLESGGVGEVAHIAATGKSISDVLSHMFNHAWQQGAAGLTGRIPPRYMRALSNQSCQFRCCDDVALVHSPNPKLMRTFDRGDAFLTHLEGEGCLYLGMNSLSKKFPMDDTPPIALPKTADARRVAGEPDVERLQQLVAQVAD